MNDEVISKIPEEEQVPKIINDNGEIEYPKNCFKIVSKSSDLYTSPSSFRGFIKNSNLLSLILLSNLEINHL